MYMCVCVLPTVTTLRENQRSKALLFFINARVSTLLVCARLEAPKLFQCQGPLMCRTVLLPSSQLTKSTIFHRQEY